MKNYVKNEIDIIVPISLELDWPTQESIVDDILFLNKEYGFCRFALACPGAGWRSKCYPPDKVLENLAHLFAAVRNAVLPYGIECGWWFTTTLKAGPYGEAERITSHDGTVSFFSSCPLDPTFKEHFSDTVARFAKIAKPAFIITEDDYSINAASKKYGCFCKHHLNAFATITGKKYSREELAAIFESGTAEGYELLRKWQKLMKESMVQISAETRRKLDECVPDIPMGTCQPGGCDCDGESTYAVASALAGKNHTPFSRLYGAFYCGGDTKDVPKAFYHALHSKQHIDGDFRFYHESDTFPHTRFFTSGKQMKVFMSAAYSSGFCGSIYQAQQLLDNPNEETAFGRMFASERIRFNEILRGASNCHQIGVEICYDPFYNSNDTVVQSGIEPLWVRCVSNFGIPFVTTETEVAFWDVRQAKYWDDETVMKYLAKGLFLDGDAAKALCERGYAKYIGVDVGEDVINGNTLIYDLGAREVICDGFVPGCKGRNMPSAHMFAPSGNGRLLRLEPIDDTCEIVSELRDFERNFVSVAMTRFKNSLGGRIIVMGETLDGNRSQSLLNYRRQKLIQSLLEWCSDSFVYACDEPGIYVIHNRSDLPDLDEFNDMFTIVNLCEDRLKSLRLHFPPDYTPVKFTVLNTDGNWVELKTEKTDDGVILCTEFDYSEPVYIKTKI